MDGGIVKFDYKMLLPRYEAKHKYSQGRGEGGGESKHKYSQGRGEGGGEKVGGASSGATKSRTKPRKRLASSGA